jgi:hypothetical protein
MLKVLVEQGYDLVDPVPSTLFCLLEFDGQRLATSHNETRNGKVKFHEEAEFSIKKSGNLKIQLCSVDGKQGILSLTEHKLYGRAKHPIEYGERLKTETVGSLELKSKSGKDRAKIRFRLTIPANPNFEPDPNRPDPTLERIDQRSKSNSSQSSPAEIKKSPKPGSSFFKRGRGGSIRSNQSSERDYGSRQSLDSAGFESHIKNNNSRDTNQRHTINLGDSNSRNSGIESNPFGSAQDLSNPFEEKSNNPFQELENISSQEASPSAVKLRQKPDRRESKKSARNSLLGSLGLGSHKEEKDDLNEDQEKSKLKQENEWLARQNKSLNDALNTKDKEIKELNTYIESLLVKIMKKAPEVLQS